MKQGWQWFSKRWKEVLGQYRAAFLVLCAGVVLLLLPGSGRTGAEEAELSAAETGFVLEDFEDRVAEILSQVEGAGETRVLLTVADDGRRELARDQEQSDGRQTSTVVTVGAGSGRQEVVALRTTTPHFRGALVVCPGGEDPQVRLRLIQSLSALTGLGADRISVCKRR